MTKRSLELAELETELDNILSSTGSIAETKWVGRFTDLMQEASSYECKDRMLKALMKTPQNEKATLSRFIQLGGIEIIGSWLNHHRQNLQPEDTNIIHSCLACLNKLSISTEILDKTQIGKAVNKLAKYADPSIQAKSLTIVSKWKKIVTEQENPKKPQKLNKEMPVALLKK